MTDTAGRPADGEQDDDTRGSGEQDSPGTADDARPRADDSPAEGSPADDSSEDVDGEAESDDHGDSDVDSDAADEPDADDGDHADDAEAEAEDSGGDAEDSDRQGAEHGDRDRAGAEDEVEADDEGAGEDEDRTGEDEDEAAEPLVPPLEPAPFVELLAAYRQPATEGAERLPWSWSTLSPAEMSASAAVLDGFVVSYNRTWAITDEQTVPPCWHRHPALAHDLATLAWAYYQAYRDPTATPDRALGFQSHLPGFAERIDRWLGADSAQCRAGRHTASWVERAVGTRGTGPEDVDAVLLLGEEDFGFTNPARTVRPGS